MGGEKRVLILTADAGFGHRSCANAIAAALRERYGDQCVTEIVNPLDDPRAPGTLRRSQSDYDRFVQAAPQLYDAGYQASDWKLPVTIAEGGLMIALHNALSDIITRNRPDVIVSTHPYYQAPVASVSAISGEYVPVLTVVTDLSTVHGLWFHRDVDLLLVPTDIVAERAIASGFPDEKIEITGLPVNPAFAHPVDRTALRADLGWEQDMCTVLFTGSKRTRKVEPVSYAFNHSVLPIQLVMVAGGDESLHRRWEANRWLRPAHVHGYVRNMPDLMMASDVIVCKAGGLTVSEALAAGLPLIIPELIPGQETGNAEFVQRAGAGEHVSSPLEALEVLLTWLDREGALLHERAAKARQAGKPEAAYRVADLAMQYAREAPPREHTLSAYAGQIREVLRRATEGLT
jgi:1,2-diacylglycerol 3-beta-galactosyltransferase